MSAELRSKSAARSAGSCSTSRRSATPSTAPCGAASRRRWRSSTPTRRCAASHSAAPAREAFSGRRRHLGVREDPRAEQRGVGVRRPARPGAARHPGLAQALARDDPRLLHGRRRWRSRSPATCATAARPRSSAFPAAKLGLAYNVEGHKRLLETVGHARAREIMFLGRRYNADEALAMGLVHSVVPTTASSRRTCDEILQTLCGQCAARHRQLQDHHRGVREVRRARRTAARMRAAMRALRESADYKEGRRAFMEKRKPRFEGGK